MKGSCILLRLSNSAVFALTKDLRKASSKVLIQSSPISISSRTRCLSLSPKSLSTIGIFGPTTPKQDTPQNSSFEPATVYGISKFTGELWSDYFNKRYGLDVRGLRYPGVISHKVRPAGGTTDFAVEIFFDAREKSSYNCYLKAGTRLPMMYMPDVMKATLELMHADRSSISTSMAYNIHGFSLSPEELAAEIKNYLPDFEISYNPDHRQAIADSWTESIDDSLARRDWSWNAEYDMTSMVKDMIEQMIK